MDISFWNFKNYYKGFKRFSLEIARQTEWSDYYVNNIYFGGCFCTRKGIAFCSAGVNFFRHSNLDLFNRLDSQHCGRINLMLPDPGIVW